MRSTNPANEQKAYAARVEGLAVKLEMDGNLPEFYESMTRKLQGTGLDTIVHARDPFRPNEKPMVMVIKNHARYTSNLEFNIEKINEFAEANYDEFDQLNDNDAQEFLFHSISDQLRSDLQLVVEHSDCFVSVYLRLMDLVVSVSSAHHDKLRESIRTTLPSKYPGEDVKALCDFYKEASDELYRASQFDPTLVLDMLQNISSVSVNGSFTFDILSKHKEVKDCLDRNAGLPREDIDNILLKQKLNYVNILKFSTKTYNDLLKDQKWPPAQSPTDSANKALATLNHLTTPDAFASSVLALVQKKMEGKGKKDRTCFICGSTDHLAKDCPQKKTPDSAPSATSDNKKKKNWKRVPPEDSETETKKVGKRTFYWCAECNRWSTTHSTDTHVKKSDSTPGANLMFEPGAWCLYADDESTKLAPEESSYPSSMHFTMGYLVMTYFFMVFYLVRNDISRLSIVFSNVGYFSLYQSFLTLLNGFGGIQRIGDFFLSFMSTVKPWIGPLCAPLLWLLLSFSAFWMSHHETITSVDIIDSKMKRRDRRTYERYQRKSLKSQLKKFRPTRLPSPRVHGKYLSRSHFKKAPSLSARNRKARYDSIYDSCEGSIRACSKRFRSSTQQRRDRRFNKLFRRHLDGVRIRKPCRKRFHNMSKYENFVSCFNTCSTTDHQQHKEKTFPVIWDSGASVCITPDRYDFLNFSSKPTLSRLNSVGGGHDVDGEGEVLWSIVDATGMLRQLKVKAYYVPTSRVRLLSTNALLQHYPDETMKHDRDSLVLSGVSGDRSRNSIIVDLHHTSRLPISTAYRYGTAFSFSAVSEAAVLSVTSAENANLSEAEKELLRWHFKLGHITFSKVQHLMRSGILAHSEGMRRLHKAASSLKNAPKCAACAFAKQRVRSSPGRKKLPFMM